MDKRIGHIILLVALTILLLVAQNEEWACEDICKLLAAIFIIGASSWLAWDNRYLIMSSGQTGTSQQPLVLPEDDFQKFVILGLAEGVIALDNYKKGKSQKIKEKTIDIPEGTTQMMVALKGFTLLFGKKSYEEGTAMNMTVEDHHFGAQLALVDVVNIEGTKATLRASLLLRDDNGDDKWSGTVTYEALCLGPPPSQ